MLMLPGSELTVMPNELVGLLRGIRIILEPAVNGRMMLRLM
jgi:hypothetical protein